MLPPSEMLVSQAALVAELMDRALDHQLKEIGLNHRSFEFLSAIKAVNGRAPQAEVAKRLGIKPPSFTEAIQPLLAAGWIRQENTPGDMRSKRLFLTEEGETKLRLALKEIAAIDAQIKAELDVNMLKVTLSSMRRAARILARLANSEED